MSAFDAKSQAQRIAYAPIVFQVCRVSRELGVLDLLRESGANGVTLEEVTKKIDLPRYGLKILLEAGLGIGLFYLIEDRYTLTKLGYFILRDPMTRINMDVVHHVCYRGFYYLAEALRDGRPTGLKTLGTWKTFYEGLSSLAPEERESWLAFDHYYSDLAFPASLQRVFAKRPKRILDIGGNTGKWAIRCATHDPNVHITIADLPQQVALARSTIQEHRLESRVDFVSVDLLDESAVLPKGYDVIWMSQFLDCFSQPEIVSILRRVVSAMAENSSLYILELYWDRQPNATAAFCLQQTSMYFACIANGNSQMYHSADMLKCIGQTGLEVFEDHDQVGPYHTLFICQKR